MKSGSFNKLSQMLIGKNLFIVPDLQRDYCWGNFKSKERGNTLVHNFCNDFVSKAKSLNLTRRADISYGIMYTYEYPESFYYLSDGQQRLTTLFLIIGILYNYTKDDRLRGLIITDDNQPRLKYEVRTSTDYFINYLVKEVFLSNENQKDLYNIQQSNWFRDDFRHDPSIKSMINALKTITSIIKKSEASSIVNFVLESIGFVFINLRVSEGYQKESYTKVREYGEKMYEIVNTRGNPMEPNEHLKVKLLSKLSNDEKAMWTEKWEMWQDFFWQRKAPDHESSDEGFNEFISWVQIIKGRTNQINDVSEIEKYFKSLLLLYSINIDLIRYQAVRNNAAIFNIETEFHKKKPANLVVIIPALIYLKSSNLISFNNENGYSIDKDNLDIETIFRFLRFFTNLSKNSEAISVFINLVSKLKYRDDITKLSNFEDDFNSIKLSEEVFKLKLFNNADAHHRKALEDTFWQAEDFNFISGKLYPIFNWMDFDLQDGNLALFDLNLFKSYFGAFKSLFNNEETTEYTRFSLLAHNDNWDIFREGWSRGCERFYLGRSDDRNFWFSKASNEAFKTIVQAKINGAFDKNYAKNAVMNLQDVNKRKILRQLILNAGNYWQWRNNKRFFYHEGAIYLPNGQQAKSYTAKIEPI